MQKVTIVGLGYVGLPLLLLVAEKGYNVIGYDINKNKIDLLRKGEAPIAFDDSIKEKVKKLKDRIIFTSNSEIALKDTDIVIICVPTPVYNKGGKPDLRPLISATETISRYIKKGELVIVESTIFPGTCEEIIKPILEKKGLKAGNDFYIAHCPERIDPGNKKYNVKNIPRVIGALSKKGLEKAMSFYESILDAKVFPMNTIKEAEAVKVVENSFRDINIAFMNELAKAFDVMRINLINVIKGASTKPFGFMPHWPGIGVGGHCIPVDPYYLIEKSAEMGFNLNFLRMARQINESMPDYTVHKIMVGLNKIGKAVKGTTIAVLGLAYKKEVDDTRNSPAIEIIKRLKVLGANVRYYDPFLIEKSTHKSLDEALNGATCVVIATDHNIFREIKPEKFKENNVKVVIDGRNIYNEKEFKDAGIVHLGIGKGQ